MFLFFPEVRCTWLFWKWQVQFVFLSFHEKSEYECEYMLYISIIIYNVLLFKICVFCHFFLSFLSVCPFLLYFHYYIMHHHWFQFSFSVYTHFLILSSKIWLFLKFPKILNALHVLKSNSSFGPFIETIISHWGTWLVSLFLQSIPCFGVIFLTDQTDVSFLCDN